MSCLSVNLRKKILGIPIFVWFIVAILIGTVAAATVISNILTSTTTVTGGTPPVQITWNQQIPAATTVGQSYPWTITTQTSQSYTATLVIDLLAAIPLSDPSIITVTAGSQAGGSQAVSPVTFTAQANGHLQGQRSSLTVPSGINVAQFLGTWTFNSNAPSTSYTIQFWFQV